MSDRLAASMRPPAIQAERSVGVNAVVFRTESFNEAACNTGGTRLQGRRLPAQRRPASMRPPAIQAERPTSPTATLISDFHASMRPPAIQAERAACARPARTTSPGGFNEAACNTGGTPRHWSARGTGRDRASMRPPAIQAERAVTAGHEIQVPSASMRPPAIQAERDRVPVWNRNPVTLQ